MTDQQTKRVVVVLSAGRSGTSLLMKALGAMGMKLSENMIPGSVGNPEGHFEDAGIVEVHKQLFSELGGVPTLPLPQGWLESDAVKKARPALRKILEHNLSESTGIWGFKDPRTVAFLPLWNRILNAPGTVPVFVLAVRDPAVVATSLNRQINRENIITELQWLQRTTDALHHTAADCYIVHYEDWFTRPKDLAQDLLTYTGLDQYFTGSVDEAIKDVVKPKSEPGCYDDYEVKNEYLLKLYDVLKDCHGAEFDRDRLMAVVKECRRAMDGFKGWYMEAQRHIGQQAQVRERLEEEQEQKKDLKERLENERERVEKKQAELERVQQGLEKSTAELESSKTRAVELESALSQGHAELKLREQELENAGDAAEQEIRRLESELDGARKRHEEKSSELEAAQKRTAELEQTLSQRQAEHEAYMQEFQKAKKMADARKEEINELTQVFEQELQEVRDATEERIKQLKAENEQRLQEKDKCIGEMENDLHEITLQNNEYLKQVKDLHDEKENLRISLSAARNELTEAQNAKKKAMQQKQTAQQKNKQPQKPNPPQNYNAPANVQKLEREVFELHNSYSFRIGQIFVNAVAKPGINTVMVPFRLLKLVFEPLCRRMKS